MAGYTFQPFGPSVAYAVNPMSINDSGQLVGYFSEGIGDQGFLMNGSDPDIVLINFPGARSTYLTDINESGQIIGWGQDYAIDHAYLRDPSTGSFTDIDIPGSTFTIPVAIDDAGRIAVNAGDNPEFTHAFIEDTKTGTITPITPPGAQFSEVDAMNNVGQVVGYYMGAGQWHGFVEDTTTGTFTTFDPPGSTESAITGINDSGEFVGWYSDGQKMHAFLDDPKTGKFTVYDRPGSVGTYFKAINNEGLIIGNQYPSWNSGTGDGFVYDSVSGETTIIDPSGALMTYPVAINDAGEVAGWYSSLYSQSTGFIATPPSAPPCYCRGTLILTDAGEVPVERLAVGDRLVTASGGLRPIIWIGRRSYSGRYANANCEVLPVCFKAGSLSDGVPARDLWVSPKHAIFVDDVLVPAEDLVNGVSIVKAERVEDVHYVHVELESHDVIVAEGALAETFVNDGDGRAVFENAPACGRHPPATNREDIYCAPRVEDGFRLQDIRRRLCERAGLPVAVAPVFGALRGRIEQIDADVIRGWAQDQRYPDGPVCLDVIVDGSVVARVLAERYRGDLRRAGIGDGCHAFETTLPSSLPPTRHHAIEVRRSADGATLANRSRPAPTPPEHRAVRGATHAHST